MEYRTKTTIKFEPEGPEIPGPVTSFQLVRTVEHQARRSDREAWRQEPSPKREVVADGITRRQVVDLISDGADWLCYVEGEM